MRHRTGSGRALDCGLRPYGGYDLLRDRSEGMGFAGGDIERTETSMHEHAQDDLGYVIDEHMIAPLFAFAKQNDVGALSRQSPEAVRPVAIMRIRRAINQRRTQHGNRRTHL